MTVKRQLGRLREEVGIDIVPKQFRKDFACRMEVAGAGPELINLHQGRGQVGVLFKNYITDMNRAVTLCRPFIDRMFGERRGGLSVVKSKSLISLKLKIP